MNDFWSSFQGRDSMTKEKETRHDRRKAETKARILKVAVDLFLAQGYEKTTVEQITSSADVAKGTFFNHFPTKEAVLYYLGKMRVEMLQEMLLSEMSNLQNSKEKVQRVFQMLSGENERNKEMTALITREMFSKQLVSMNEEKESQRILKDALVLILIEGQRSGEFRLNFEPEHAANLMVSSYFYTLFQWLENETKQTLGKELADRLDIILAGVSN
jgi:TetR/AcrR family transcriptional regulator, cholesterol catabolism regulator